MSLYTVKVYQLLTESRRAGEELFWLSRTAGRLAHAGGVGGGTRQVFTGNA